jgi:hypothetical protein
LSKARDLANNVRRFGFTPTGVYLPYALSTPPNGWLLMDGRTIGSAASGATSRASADCYDLYVGLWASMTNTEAPVTGGRGASAAADWSANKPIAIPDHRGRVPAGKDDMGGSAANRLTSGGSGVPGSVLGGAGGSQSHILTEAQLPSSVIGAGGSTIARGSTVSDLRTVGSGAAHPNAQPTFVANMIIKL